MFKKSKYFFISLIMLLGLILSGCGGSTSDNDEEKIVNVILPSGDGNEEPIEEITERFEDENPNIDVNIEFVEYDSLKQKILTSAETGEYDVAMVDLPWLAQFANANIVQEVPEELSEEEKEDIFDPILEGVVYQDTMYSMPWKNDTKFLFYNKDMLEEADIDTPPETWEDFENQSKKLKDQDIVKYPSVWSWSQGEALIADYAAIVGGFDGALVEDENPKFTEEGTINATEFMANLLDEDLANPNSTEYEEQDVQDNFIQGDSAFALNWAFMYEEIEGSDFDDDFGVTLVPGSGDTKSSSVYGGEGLSVTSGSENPDEAWEYIKYLTSKDVQIENVDITMPIWESIFDDKEVLEQENAELVETAKEQFDYMAIRPQTPAYGDLSDATSETLQDILINNNNVKSKLSELQTKNEEILKED